jgi:monoamine oxidase
MATLLDELPLGPGARAAIAAHIQVSATQPLDRLAATSMEHSGSTFDTHESLRVAGGNQRLALALAAAIGRVARLGAPVEAVSWSDLALDTAGAVLATWQDDPWARAAHSTRAPGASRGDDELLARPVGPLHFAGEHTAGEWAGLIEGALRSGQRAAREVLAR